MEKRKVTASNSYRGKASDYYLGCSCSLRVQKAREDRKKHYQSSNHHYRNSR